MGLRLGNLDKKLICICNLNSSRAASSGEFKFKIPVFAFGYAVVIRLICGVTSRRGNQPMFFGIRSS